MTYEKQLVNQLKDGSQAAFKLLVESYQDRLLNICLGFIPDYQEAEDIVQEVFIEVYRSIAGFREDAQLSTWLYRICVNKSLEQIRAKKRKKRLGWLRSISEVPEPELTDELRHPGIQLENQERAKILFCHIQQLPENQRIAFVLHKVDGLSHQEVCDIMKSSISAVESLVHRARKNLQKSLYRYYKENLF